MRGSSTLLLKTSHTETKEEKKKVDLTNSSYCSLQGKLLQNRATESHLDLLCKIPSVACGYRAVLHASCKVVLGFFCQLKRDCCPSRVPKCVGFVEILTWSCNSIGGFDKPWPDLLSWAKYNMELINWFRAWVNLCNSWSPWPSCIKRLC